MVPGVGPDVGPSGIEDPVLRVTRDSCLDSLLRSQLVSQLDRPMLGRIGFSGDGLARVNTERCLG